MNENSMSQLLSEPVRLAPRTQLVPERNYGPPPQTRVDFIDIGQAIRASASQPADAINSYLLLIVSVCAGYFGVDRFLAGQKLLGTCKLLTLGGVGLWWLTDIVLILAGKFSTKQEAAPQGFLLKGILTAGALLLTVIMLIAGISYGISSLAPKENSAMTLVATASIQMHEFPSKG